MSSRNATFSIPLTERGYQWVMAEARKAGKIPSLWLDLWILDKLEQISEKTGKTVP